MHQSVLVTAFTVNVAVSHFFLGSVADGNDLHLEVQALASQRVVAVNGDVIAVQITDGDDLHLAVRRGSVELHAHFQLVNAFRSEERRVGKECRSRWSPYH